MSQSAEELARLRQARELFFQYDGSTFYMSRDGADRRYAELGVPRAIEQAWLEELTDRKLAALDNAGNWWTINFLVHHQLAGHLARVVASEPRGELWERLSYLELLLKYLEVSRAGGASWAEIQEVLNTIGPRAASLLAACRSEATRHRAQNLITEIERRQRKIVARGGRAAKRITGRIQNIANQVAQIAAGFEASFDGPVLLEDQPKGRYSIDLVKHVSEINGREVRLGMISVLGKWLDDEIVRLDRDREWLLKGSLVVDYKLVPSGPYMDSHPEYWTSQAYMVELAVRSSIVTKEGEAQGSFENVQSVIGQVAAEQRPMPPYPMPSNLRGQPIDVRRSGRRRGQFPKEAG